jgi:hypothetical protein
MILYLNCADVGPRWPEGFPRHVQHGRDDQPWVDAYQVLDNVHKNLDRLVHPVPMI